MPCGISWMIYKGVEFSVTAVAPDVWKWQFLLGGKVIAGKTEAKLNLLAIRRVQLRIDRELKKASSD
jgi:energy-converting hydrogenase Eha subunit G